jgi:hypothetical protein
MQIRARKMGFVFQDFNLVPTRTALENVMLAGEYAGIHGSANRKAALDALDLVGLGQAPGWRVRPGSTLPRTHARAKAPPVGPAGPSSYPGDDGWAGSGSGCYRDAPPTVRGNVSSGNT